jgi:hypothetical protein
MVAEWKVFKGNIPKEGTPLCDEKCMHGTGGIDVTVYFSLGKAYPAKMNHDMTIGSDHHLLFLCYNVLLRHHRYR